MFEFQWNQRPSEPPGTPSRSAGTRPFRSSLLWMACSWSFALPLDGHWLYPFGGHNLLGAIVFFSNFCLLFNCQVFAPVCFLDCIDLMFVYAQHVFLVYACKVLFVMVHVCLMLWSLLFFCFFPHVCKKGNDLPWTVRHEWQFCERIPPETSTTWLGYPLVI